MTIRLPQVTVNIASASNPVNNQPQKMLFIGQMTTGTATSGSLYQNILNDASWDTLFGKKSALARMIRAAKLINNVSSLDAIPLADNVGGVAASGSVIFSAASVVGTVSLVVGSALNNTYTTAVTLGQTGESIAAAMQALINADAVGSVAATIETLLGAPSFTGIGLNDLDVSGTYTDTVSTTYLIEIDAADTTDTFKWSDDNGATYTEDVSITGSAQLLSHGVSIAFDAVTGHTLGEKWSITATAGVLKLTAINKGTEGNSISLGVSSSITNYTATLSRMDNGATNPVLTSLFSNIANIRYQTIVYPSSYDLTVLKSFLDPRWNVTNRVLDGVGFMSITNLEAGLVAIGNGLNDQNLCIHGNKEIIESNLIGSAIVEFDCVIASQIAAINALRLTEGANISQYLISGNGLLDNLGGAAIASLPFFNTPVANLPIIANGNEWTDEEMAALKAAGIFVLGNNPTATEIIFGETVTTYKTDAASNPDPTYKYLEYVETASNIREYFYNNVRARFAQCRLTNGDIVGGRAMANAAVISAYFDALYNTLSGSNYVLTQAGEAARKFFVDNKTVTLDLATGTATVTMIVPIVTQLRSIYATMQIAFDFNS